MFQVSAGIFRPPPPVWIGLILANPKRKNTFPLFPEPEKGLAFFFSDITSQFYLLCFILAEYTELAFNNSVNTSSTAVTGHPALSINVGFSSGLPVGMMIVGKEFHEATLLNVAFAYENIRDSVN